MTTVGSSFIKKNIHITIIELNALHTKRQNLFQELDAVIHLLMEAKHWGLRKSRNATSLNSRFKSLDTLKVKIISVTFRRVIRTNHKKASKIWRHENIYFLQAEDGIRYLIVTGVQTCALPISLTSNYFNFGPLVAHAAFFAVNERREPEFFPDVGAQTVEIEVVAGQRRPAIRAVETHDVKIDRKSVV